MADSNHPVQPSRPEVVRIDHGGWISGPSADAEPVEAGQVRPGDVLVLDDGTRAEVTDVRHGDYWLNTGCHGRGVAIGWRSGSSSGVLFRQASELLPRLAS